MASNKDNLKQYLEEEFQAVGMVLEGEFAMGGKLATAISNAVVRHLQADATVTVTKGNSAGTYKVD